MRKYLFLFVNLVLIAYGISVAIMIHQALDIYTLRDLTAKCTWVISLAIIANTVFSFFIKGNKYSRLLTALSCVAGVLFFNLNYDYFLPY